MAPDPAPTDGPFETLCQLLDWDQVTWAIGTFGALAEFSYQSRDQPVFKRESNSLSITTKKGGLRITDHPLLKLVPYEGLSNLKNAWTQGIMVCLPSNEAQFGSHSGLTRMGNDPAPIAQISPRTVLYDLGLGVEHLKACVRTDDKDLQTFLDRSAGASLFDKELGLTSRLVKESPTRVFMTKCGRIEIYQDIPNEDGTTPLGPHTHVSEKLLARSRTQAATIPIPDGWLPILACYPPNPVRDVHGAPRAFDQKAHTRFQSLYSTFADPSFVAIKTQIMDAIRQSREPDTFEKPATKEGRTVLRVAIRQAIQQHGSSELLSRWQKKFEPRKNHPRSNIRDPL